MEGAVIHGTIGYYPSQTILRGEFGSAVYRGFDFHRFDPERRRDAAVICFENTGLKIVDKEIEIYFAQTTTFDNVHNYRWFEKGIDKTLIAAEPICFTLYDAFTTQPQADRYTVKLRPAEVLRQAAQGVRYLHSLNIMHRAIKPQNFFIAETQDGRQVVKLSGFGISKETVDGEASFSAANVASGGWCAPEMLSALSTDQRVRLTAAVDIFSLGCVFYFVLCIGSHPFDPERKREVNILENKFNLDKVTSSSLEFFLIKSMISKEPEDRPKITDILRNPYFLEGEFHVLYTGDGHTVPGYCLIINQKEFTNAEDAYRNGTDQDRDNLRKTFEMFGYKVDVQENLTAAELRAAVRSLSQQDLSRYQSLAICLLSHGDENRICGTDMIPVELNLLKEYFNGVLVGKPKMFIIQACRGDEHQRGTIPTANSTAIRTTMQTDAIPILQPGVCSYSLVPGMSNFLEIYATTQGYYAYRCELQGSVFISKLCRKLQTEGDQMDFLSILLAVNEEMSAWSTTVEDRITRQIAKVKQMSEVRHSLTKNIQLKRC